MEGVWNSESRVAFRPDWRSLAGSPSDCFRYCCTAVNRSNRYGCCCIYRIRPPRTRSCAGFDEAWHRVGEAMTAMETTKEIWCEVEVHRMAGEIALGSAPPGCGESANVFDHALAVARAQQAKSWSPAPR